MEKFLARFNEITREEHGDKIGIDDFIIDSNVDSFGITMVLLELHEEYKCFPVEWLKDEDIEAITVRDLYERTLDESNKL